MELLKILKIEKNDGWISVKIQDKKEKFTFWIDCGLIDGFGNRKDFKTDDLYIDWDWNQYIFFVENEYDIQAQKYQKNPENIDRLTDFIDKSNDYLVNILKNMEVL